MSTPASDPEYRARMTPEEMRALRTRYGLGQRAFSLLLGWGEITLHRYERGANPDAAHDAQLRLATDPDNIRVLLEANGHKLTVGQRQRLITRLRNLTPGTFGPVGLLAGESGVAYAASGHTRTAPDDMDRRALLRLPLADRSAILREHARAAAREYSAALDHEWLDADLGEWDHADE